jgi:plastocyanin domain-containing protein
VTEKGYEPTPITLNKDEPVKMVVTRTTEHTCANDLVMKDYGINTPLPLNQPVEIAFTPTKTGTLTYGCAMGQMISGTFMVE